jgi:hypothetical protein
MGWRNALFRLLTVAIASASWVIVAQAQCPALPYALTNGQPADATQVMANFNDLFNCINTPTSLSVSGPGGGVVSIQNPAATANYNFNLPTSAGASGAVLASGGGGTSPSTWVNVGTSGHTLPYLDGANTWSGTQTFGPVIGAVSTQTGTTYTLAATDCGTTILFTGSSAITLTTLNSLPAGCSIAIEQAGAGQVTISAGSGATQHSPHGYTKTFGQYAILGLFVDTNTGGSAANLVITGDGA